MGPSQSLLKLLSINTAGEEVEEKAVICLRAMLAQKQMRLTHSEISTAAFLTMRTGRAENCPVPGERCSLPASHREPCSLRQRHGCATGTAARSESTPSTTLLGSLSSVPLVYVPLVQPLILAVTCEMVPEKGADRSAFAESGGALRSSAGDVLGLTLLHLQDRVLLSDYSWDLGLLSLYGACDGGSQRVAGNKERRLWLCPGLSSEKMWSVVVLQSLFPCRGAGSRCIRHLGHL